MQIGSLEIQLMADLARLKKDMDDAKGVVGRAMADIDRAVGVAKGALGALGIGVSGAGLVLLAKQAIDAADQLNDLSKSTDIAAGKLAGLKLAGMQSGSNLESVAQSINKLSQNIGKDAEKFERIGITAKQPLEVFKQLADVYNSISDPQLRAAVAAEALGKNWAGAAPLLAEGSARIQEMVDKGELLSGVNQDIVDSSDEFNDRLAELQTGMNGVTLKLAGALLPLLTALTEDLTDNATGAREMVGSFDPVVETLRTLIVVGGNVGFVLKTIGTEVGGIAAQAAAIGRGDMAGAMAIGREMKADAEKSRAAFDLWEKRMMAAGSAAKATAKDAVDAKQKLTDAQVSALKLFADNKAAKDAGAAAAKAAEEFERLWNKITGKEIGVDADFNKNIETLKSGLASGRISIEEYTAAVQKYMAQQPYAAAAAKAAKEAYQQQVDVMAELDAAYVAESKAREQGRLAVDAYVQGITEANTQIELEQSLFGQSERNRSIALEQYRIELDLKKQIAAINANTGFDQSQRDDEIARARSAAELAKTAAVAKADMVQLRSLFDAFDNTAHEVFVNIFDDGSNAFKKLGQSLKAGLIDVLYQLTLKQWIISIGANVTGMGGSMLANAASSGSSLLGTGSNLLSTGASIAGLAGGFNTASTLGAFGSSFVGSAASTLGFAEAGSTLAASSAASTAAGFGGASSAGAALGAVAPYLAAAIAIYYIAKNLDHSGTPHIGAGTSYSATGGLAQASAGATGGGLFSGITYSDSTQQMTTGLVQSIVGILDSTAVTFGKSAGYQAAASFADDSSKDGAWGSLVISKLGEVVSGWAVWAGHGQVFSDGAAGSAEYLAKVSSDVRAALDGIGLPSWATAMLDKLGASPSLDQLAAVVAEINKTESALTAIGKVLVGFNGLSDTAVQALIKAAGGIDNLSAAAASYYRNFYSDDEKRANSFNSIRDALAAVNLVLPETDKLTHGWLRTEVEKAQALGDAGMATVAALLGVNELFNELVPAATELTTAVDGAGSAIVRTASDIADSIKSLQDTGAGLQVDLLNAQGDTAGAQALQRALDTAGFTDAEIAAYDFNAQLRALIETTNAATEAARAEADQRASLQDQLDSLTLTAAQQLERQRNALDESNRALFDQVQAATAAAEAERALAEQTQRVTAERTSLQDQLDNLTMTATQLLEKQRNALDESNRALFDQVQAATAAAKAAAEEQAAQEKAAQDAERAAQAAADALQKVAAAAAAAAQKVLQEHDGLYRQYLSAIGDTAALRALELAALDPSNRALQEQIWAIEDQKAAADEATAAAEQMKSAWGSLTDSITTEVRRIRGLIDESSGASYASLAAQFATATAQTRAGDQEAARLLPGLSQSLLTAFEATATSLVDLQRQRALTANSLEQTASLAGGTPTATSAAPVADSTGRSRGTALATTAGTAYSVVATAPAYGLADMVVELRGEIAALKDEVKGLRAEALASGGAIAANTGGSLRLHKQWNDVGLPITTETDLAAVYGA